METSLASSPTDIYHHYLQSSGFSLAATASPHFIQSLEATHWDEPQSALELNNFAVIALIEAEQSEDLSVRAMNLDMALEALTMGVEQQPGHPLCTAHLAIVRSMVGEDRSAIDLAFPVFVNLLQFAYTTEAIPGGLIYLPPLWRSASVHQSDLQTIFQLDNGYTQALSLLSLVLCHAQLVFYSSTGARFSQLALQFFPNSPEWRLKLGLTHLMSQIWEGLLHLHQAVTVAPEYAAAVQALYLGYRELQQWQQSSFWHQYASDRLHQNPDTLDWQWSRLAITSPFTYVPFDDLLLTVESSIRSIVTTVLLGQGDWFEAEMEFWRTQLQPGMTVIDVGANVGVYTFSAAKQVGATGRVLAVEPFSGCVHCLEETRRVNQLDWVTVCAGAASDHPGTARLSLHSASELNEVITDDSVPPEAGKVEEVACFTLDSLISQHQLDRVDWLKIDAEGHEMKVLAGCDRLLTEFAPAILYENIAGAHSSNTPVAEFLQSIGYQLFRYQPYLQQLIPLESIDSLQGNLNIVALPPNHPLIQP